MILATFLDPNGNGLDVADMGALFAATLAGASVAYGAWRVARKVWRWVCERIRATFTALVHAAVEPLIEDKLMRYTYPIQPEANGGKSLPDLNRKVDALITHLGVQLEGNEA